MQAIAVRVCTCSRNWNHLHEKRQEMRGGTNNPNGTDTHWKTLRGFPALGIARHWQFLCGPHSQEAQQPIQKHDLQSHTSVNLV